MFCALFTGCDGDGAAVSADGGGTNGVRIVDLKPSAVLAVVSGRRITVADFNRRLEFEKKMYAMRHRKTKSAEQLEADQRRFEAARRQQILLQLLGKARIDAYLEAEKLDIPPGEREQARVAMVSWLGHKGDFESLASALGESAEYVEAQQVYPRQVKLAREHFDPGCATVTEREVDEGLARQDAYYERAIASNAVTFATCSNLMARVAAGELDLPKAAAEYGAQDVGEAREWDTFDPTELNGNKPFKDWAFSAPVGSLGGPFEMEDGISVVKLLSREEGTMEESLASEGLASVTLARVNFDMVEPEPEPRTREFVRTTLLNWKGERAQQALFERLEAESPVVFPLGNVFDFSNDDSTEKGTGR